MRRVKFLVDFRGKETKEVFYTAGTEAEFTNAVAEQLAKDGRAEFVELVPAEVKTNEKNNPKRNYRRKR